MLILISYNYNMLTSYAHTYQYQGPMPDGVTCCPKNHFGFLASGKMKIMMVDTGEEQIISAGEAYYVPPKHDAIMLEDTVMLEFESTAAEYYGKLDDK